MASMFAYFNLDLKTGIKSNTLNFVVATVLLQKYYNRILRLVAFIAKKMFFAKCNYKIYNKKLLHII